MTHFLIYSDLHYELGGRFIPPAHLRGAVDTADGIACGNFT